MTENDALDLLAGWPLRHGVPNDVEPAAAQITIRTPPPGWTITTTGRNVIIKPESLGRGESFTIEIGLPRVASGDFQAWFISETDADAGQLGSAAPLGQTYDKETDVGRFLVRDMEVKSPSGSLLVGYVAREPQQPGGAVRIGRAVGNSKSMFQRYLGEAMRIALPMLIENSRSTTITRASTPGSGNQSSNAPRPPGASSEPLTTKLPPVKAPTGYRIILEMEFPIGFGGMPQAKQIPYLLLADGHVVKYPELPHDEFDVEAFKRQRNSIWGRWRQSGKKILVAWPDGKTSELTQHIILLRRDKWRRARPECDWHRGFHLL